MRCVFSRPLFTYWLGDHWDRVFTFLYSAMFRHGYIGHCSIVCEKVDFAGTTRVTARNRTMLESRIDLFETVWDVSNAESDPSARIRF